MVCSYVAHRPVTASRFSNWVDDARLEGSDFIGQVFLNEQSIEILATRIRELVIDVGERYGLDRQTDMAHDPVLNRTIEHVAVLDRGGGLDLDRPPAGSLRYQHIYPHQYAVD